jgi:hypothetical protein
LEEPLVFEFELQGNKCGVCATSTAGEALANAVVDEFAPADWRALEGFLCSVKRGQMDTMDLDTVLARFPEDVVAGEHRMVGYAEVFPWDRSVEFELRGSRWRVLDHHCIERGCSCTEVALGFCAPRTRAGQSGGKRRAVNAHVTARFDFVEGTYKREGAGRLSPTLDEIFTALRSAHPRLNETLAARHQQLARLADRLLPRNRQPRVTQNGPVTQRIVTYEDPRETGSATGAPGQPATARVAASPSVSTPPAAVVRPEPFERRDAKVGRNEPCPCGSGRKYKRCCGA